LRFCGLQRSQKDIPALHRQENSSFTTRTEKSEIHSFKETIQTDKKISNVLPPTPKPIPIDVASNAPEVLQTEMNSEEIDRSSITKKSALDFFKTKIKEGKDEERKTTETPKLRPFVYTPPVEDVQTPPAPETFSKQSELISQFKRTHSVDEGSQEPATTTKVEKDAITLARESYSLVQEADKNQQSSLFSKTMYTELPFLTTPLLSGIVDSEFKLTPEPPPEMGFIQAPETPIKIREDISQKVKKLEEFHKVQSPLDAPSGGVRLFPVVSPKPQPVPEPRKSPIPEKREEKPIETLPALSWLSETPKQPDLLVKKQIEEEVIEKKTVKITNDAVKPFVHRVEDLKQNVVFEAPKHTEVISQSEKSQENYVEKSHLGVYRPSSAIEVRPCSPRPSAEALQMEKLWANRRDDAFSNFKDVKTQPAPKPLVYHPPPQKPIVEECPIERQWTPVKTPIRPATSLGVIDRSASPRPSQEGLAMDRMWAHKHRESNLKKSWPPTKSDEEKPIIPWATSVESGRSVEVSEVSSSVSKKEEANNRLKSNNNVVTSSETVSRNEEAQNRLQSTPTYKPAEVSSSLASVIKSEESRSRMQSSEKVARTFTNTAPPPTMLTQKGPVLYYNAQSRLVRQTQSMDRQIVKESSYKETNASSSTLRRTWTPSVEQNVKSAPDYFGLEPGPAPSMGFAPAPERRTSLVEEIEQGLSKEIQKLPSKQLAGAVRIIPPPPQPTVTPKNKVKRTNSLEAKPFEKFPELEPFPFKPDTPQLKTAKCPPPPTPSKFIKGNFAESDYESDYESRMNVKWRPLSDGGQELQFKPVRPPSTTEQLKRPQSVEPQPLAPSKFEKPAGLQGPSVASRPVSSQAKPEIIKPESLPLKPGTPPEFVEVPRALITSESGYMADTEDISRSMKRTATTRSSHITQSTETLKSKNLQVCQA